MKNFIKAALIFSLGVATGYLIREKIVEKRYEKIDLDLEEEPEDIPESKIEDAPPNEYRYDWGVYGDYTDIAEKYDTSEKEDVVDRVSLQGTRQFINDVPKTDETCHPGVNIIPSEEFGIEEDYEKIDLTIFSDLILTDDSGHEMSNLEFQTSLSGAFSIIDISKLMATYDTDVIYVQDDYKKCYYEIVSDSRSYDEYANSVPRLKAERMYWEE